MSSTHARPSFPRRFGTAAAALALSFSTVGLIAPPALAASECGDNTMPRVSVTIDVPSAGSVQVKYVAAGSIDVYVNGGTCTNYTNVSELLIKQGSGGGGDTKNSYIEITASTSSFNTKYLPATTFDLEAGEDSLEITGTSGSDVLDGTVFTYNNGGGKAGGLDSIEFNGGGGNDTLVDNKLIALSDITFGGGGGTDTVDRSDRTVKVEYTMPIDIENYIGSSGVDEIEGNLLPNRIEGGKGDDKLHGNGGNDLLLGNDDDDDLYGGDGNDTLVGGDDDDKFDGGTGTDFVSYDDGVYPDAASTRINFSLRWTSKTGTRGAGADYAVAGTVENLRGSTYDDSLVGNDKANSIDGGLGDDTIEGGPGEDVLDGGLGLDTLSYSRSPAAVRVNLAQPYPAGGDATGDLTGGFENALGSAFADTLTGTAGANELHGAGGDDLLVGLAGEDTLDGGSGSHDRVTYASSSSGVTVSLLAGTAKGGDAEGDTLTKVEDLVGSEKADVLIGSRVANVILGLGGNDMIMGGLWGDQIDGGAGIDTASYSDSSEGVTVSLRSGVVKGGAGEDRLMSMENLIGSAFADTLLGTDGANNINGGGGNDVISGLGGADRLFGSNGDDRLDGGDGNDFLEPGAGDDVANGGAGTDTCKAGPGSNTVTNCEK